MITHGTMYNKKNQQAIKSCILSIHKKIYALRSNKFIQSNMLWQTFIYMNHSKEAK